MCHICYNYQKEGEKMERFTFKNFHIQFYQDLIHLVKYKNIPYTIKKYEKNQVIALSNDECLQVGIITKGGVKIEQTLNSGETILIKSLKQYDIFGEILIFASDSKYPYDIISSTKTEIFFISKTNLLKIFKDDINLLEQFLGHISSSYLILNRLIKLKSQKTIENKLAYYFIYYKNINETNLTCTIDSKTQLANFIGIERQSLFRVLKKLQDKNYLIFNKNSITIKNFQYFQNLIK